MIDKKLSPLLAFKMSFNRPTLVCSFKAERFFACFNPFLCFTFSLNCLFVICTCFVTTWQKNPILSRNLHGKELQNAFVLVKNMHATHHDRLLSLATEFNSLCCSSKIRSDEGLGPEALYFFNLFVFFQVANLLNQFLLWLALNQLALKKNWKKFAISRYWPFWGSVWDWVGVVSNCIMGLF